MLIDCSELGNDRSLLVDPKCRYHYHKDWNMLVATVTNCDEISIARGTCWSSKDNHRNILIRWTEPLIRLYREVRSIAMFEGRFNEYLSTILYAPPKQHSMQAGDWVMMSMKIATFNKNTASLRKIYSSLIYIWTLYWLLSLPGAVTGTLIRYSITMSSSKGQFEQGK